MSQNLTQFNFHGNGVRAVTDPSGEVTFIAKDVCSVLDLANVAQALVNLDDDEKGVTTTDTPGGPQDVTTITESGLYSLVLRSRKPEAREFKRWITRDILPSIRKTGTYSATQLTRADLARMVLDAEAEIEAKTTQVLELTPRAEAWDVMVSAGGDYAVDEAAKILSRDPAIEIGRTRLFTFMAEIGWTFRQGHRNRWHAYQTAIQTGRLVERAGAAFLNSRSGEMEVAAPTIRVTPKGLEDLRTALTKEDAA